MVNQSIEEKRKIFLEKLDESYKKVLRFNKFSGPGFKKKLQRLIFTPTVYVPYLLYRLRIMEGRNKRAVLFYGKDIIVNKNDADGFLLSFAGSLYHISEYKLTKFFIKNLKESDVFYDVGANYGFYTALASDFCKEVHSFEPLPDVFQCLKMSFEDNPRVFLNNVALSDKEGEEGIVVLKVGSAGSTIMKDKFKKTNEKINKIIKVKTIKLDNYIISNKSQPTIIKLDVEGAESLVIEGGKEFFKNNNPIIVMEVWSKEEGYEISKKAIEKLRNLGYQPYFINNDGELEKIEGDLSSTIKHSFENFVFKKYENSN